MKKAMSMWVYINEQRGEFVGTGRCRALASQPSHSLQCCCSEPSLCCMPQGVVPWDSPVAGGWVFQCQTNCRRDSLLLAEMNTAWKGLWAPQGQSRPDPDSGCKGASEMLRMGRVLTATLHLPPILSQSNSIPSSNSYVFFVTLLPQGALSDPACSNRPESLFHFQTEALPEHSNPFALAEQLVTPAVSSLSIIIILIPNVCCTKGDHYHLHFSPIY